uniref:Uncharacterized protein n=1 Tax=Panagrolaimus sp. PS1159 TaxID=55785 RepID=A0AC35FCP7_9BILA
ILYNCWEMPALIPEIFFAVGKQIIENGDSENNLTKFALSGKESLNAVKKVFAAVATLKIYDGNDFEIGWDKQCTKYNINEFPESWIYLIGGSVTKLHVEKEINGFFRPIINIIFKYKKLISFSAGSGSCCSKTLFLDKFLPTFSTTLEELTIPKQTISKILCDTLGPKSLTLLYDFHQCDKRFLLKTAKNSLLTSSVKHLTISTYPYSLPSRPQYFEFIVELFPSLKTLNFSVKYGMYIELSFLSDIQIFIEIIKRSTTFPSKIVYTVSHKEEFFNNGIKLQSVRDFLKDFEYDDSSNPTFYCFRQTFHFKDSDEKFIFEVLFPKPKIHACL